MSPLLVWEPSSRDIPASGTGASLDAFPAGSAPRHPVLQQGSSPCFPAPGRRLRANHVPKGNYPSCRCSLLRPSRRGAPFVIVCESSEGGGHCRTGTDCLDAGRAGQAAWALGNGKSFLNTGVVCRDPGHPPPASPEPLGGLGCSQGCLEEHWGARGRFWGRKTAKCLPCSSGDASQFAFSKSREGALGIWENKRRKPHVCRCAGRSEAQQERGELAPKLAADGQATALGAPASSSEQTPAQQSEGLGEKHKKNLPNLAKSSVPRQENTKEEAQKSAGHFLGPLPEVCSPSQQRCAALAAFLEKLHGKKGKCQWVTGTESVFCQEQRSLRLEIDVS